MRLLFLIMCFCTSVLFASDIAVVTLVVGDKYAQTVKVGTDSKRLYCKQHGYDFICGDTHLDPSRPIPWSKIKLIEKVMENPKYKWIFWTDADSIIMNQAVRLEDLIDENYNFIITKDPYGLNTGQFFIKNCPWSRELLKKVYNDHPDCIHHNVWEQMAFINEFKRDARYNDSIKILPQRLMNSFAPEYCNDQMVTYQKGDFIIHFAGIRDYATSLQLSRMFQVHGPNIIDDFKSLGLDYYLGIYGYKLSSKHSNNNEGFMTSAQRKQFESQLALYPNITSVLEIGLNGGHSAENFFRSCKNLERFLSFDIEMHAYTKVAVEYFKRQARDRFIYVKGDSNEQVPMYAREHLQEKYDLIYVDGNHSAQGCLNDILNCKALAHESTLLWVDDYNFPCIRDVVAKLVIDKVVAIDQVFSSVDAGGAREWVQLRYL